jgi:hypothetical protein
VTEAVLGVDVGVQVALQRVAVGEHPRQGQEDAGHAHPRVTEHPTARGQPAERQPGRGDEGVREEHPHQHEVDEEPLDAG